jgi:uncharacterized protein YllA (UPF0747 family)
LLFLNPRDPALASATVEIHREALTSAPAISAALEERGRTLEASGYPVGVHVRATSPLSFFHPDGPEGPRFRLQPDGDGFTLVGRADRRFSRAELLSRLDSEPRSFSTSALLRPILEAQLLPTAMYVGGPAEVGYLAQVEPLYPIFGLPTPLVLPRARLFVVEPEVQRLLRRAELSVRDVSSGEEFLLARSRARGGDILESKRLRSEILAPALNELERRRTQLRSLGPGLERALDRTLKSAERSFDRFVRKVESAELRRDQEEVERVERLRRALFPGGVPQERVFGFSRYLARFGDGAFISAVQAAFDPFVPEIGEVRP